MKLLITGGLGFIGSNFIRYMLKEHPGITITNLDAKTYAGNLENLTDIEKDSRYSFVCGNICDPDVVESVFSLNDIDTVVHFAAESHVDRSICNSAAFYNDKCPWNSYTSRSSTPPRLQEICAYLYR